MMPHLAGNPLGPGKNISFPSGNLSCLITSVLIGRDTLLRDNPISYPVQNGRAVEEIPAVTVSIALPVPQPVEKQVRQMRTATLKRENLQT